MPSICDMTVSSVCAYQGQLFAGGFVDPWQGAGMDCVGWSRIGSAQFEMARDNTAGWMKMPGRGECLKVQPIRKGVVAYGTNSICLFYPVDQPAPTYGRHDIFEKLGIAGRDAADGDGDQHFFLSAKGDLFHLTNEIQPEKLGFRYLFGPLVESSSNVSLSWDGSNQELYLSFDSRGFIFSEYGLHEIYQTPTKVNPLNTELYASYGDVSSDGDPAFLLETDILDFGIAGLKTIMSLELLGSLAGEVYGSVSWRNDKLSDSFSDTDWVRFSPGGVCHTRVSGREIKIKLKGTSTTNVELTAINVKFLTPDNRNIRGPLS